MKTHSSRSTCETAKTRRPSHSGGNSRKKQQQLDMPTAVKEACDAASCEKARDKWLRLELERQRQVADAQSEQLDCTEQENQQLQERVRRLEAALAQHETFAQLEAQGAQQVEKEMHRLRAKLKQRRLEVFALQRLLEAADRKMQSEEKAEAEMKAASDSAWEAHRQLLRKLFALVVRANMAVQTRNTAMQYAPPLAATYCTAGIHQCMDVLESLVSLRQTCAELLSAGGMSSEALADLDMVASAAAIPAATPAMPAMAAMPAAMPAMPAMPPSPPPPPPPPSYEYEQTSAVEVSLGGTCPSAAGAACGSFQRPPGVAIRSPWTNGGSPLAAAMPATPRAHRLAAGSYAGSCVGSCSSSSSSPTRAAAAASSPAAGSQRSSRRVSFSSCCTTPRAPAGPAFEECYSNYSSNSNYSHSNSQAGQGGFHSTGSSYLPSYSSSTCSAAPSHQPLQRLKAMRAAAGAAVNALFTGVDNPPSLPPGFGSSSRSGGSCASSVQHYKSHHRGSAQASVAGSRSGSVRRGQASSHSRGGQHHVATAESVGWM